MSTTGEIIRKIMYWTAVWCDNQVELYHLITSFIQYRARVLGHEVISSKLAELFLGVRRVAEIRGKVGSCLLA